MKKLLLISLSLICAACLYATTLQVVLDTTNAEIELFGFTSTDPALKLTSLASAKGIESLSRISIQPDHMNSGTTKEASFYIWWYLYTGNAFSIKCYFNDFIANDSRTPIPFHIESASNKIYSSEHSDQGDNPAGILKTVIHTCDVSAGLNAGSRRFTIPPFNFADGEYDRGNYSTNIFVEFSSNV